MVDSMTIDSSDFFVAGGTLRAQSPSYVTRPADSDLLNHLLAGEFCYVLTARQMGKSSLMVRTAQRLQKQSVQIAIIDLTSIGTVAQEAWYLGLLSRLRSGLRLSEVDVQAWWQAHAQLSAAQRFTLFLRDVVLAAIQSQVVIFIDEIDATLGLDFRDDFFAALRAIYNARANEPVYNRLTFALFGVATPTDLIQDRERTPFNIGHRINLQEFTYTDAEPLRTGLDASHPGQGEPILQRIFFWTNGHPYLTQKLCAVIAGQSTNAWDNSAVDQVVEKNFFSDEGRKDTNLTFVQDRIAASPETERRTMLNLYRQVHQGKRIKDDDRSPVQNRLELYGLLRVNEKRLQVRNELYRRVFNADWIKANTQRQRAILAVGAMLVLLVGVIAYILNQPNPTCDTYTKQFNETKASALRIDALAGLFNANCRPEALSLFYALSPYEQEELFLDAKNIQVNSLITTIKGVYVTLDTMPEPDRYDLKLMSAMLEAMKESGVAANDPLVIEISAWHKGREEARRKRYQDAVDSYGVALALYTDHPVIHFDRAEAYIKLTRYDSALKDLDDVIRVAQMTPPTPTTSLTPTLRPSATSTPMPSAISTALSTTPSFLPTTSSFSLTLGSTSTHVLTSVLTSKVPLISPTSPQPPSLSSSLDKITRRFIDSQAIVETVKTTIQDNTELLDYYQVNLTAYSVLKELGIDTKKRATSIAISAFTGTSVQTVTPTHTLTSPIAPVTPTSMPIPTLIPSSPPLTDTPAPSATPLETTLPTLTFTPSLTPVPSRLPSTATPTPSMTPSPTLLPIPTSTPSLTPVPSRLPPTPTLTPSVTALSTPLPTSTFAATLLPIPSRASSTSTPMPTATPLPPQPPTPTFTSSPVPVPSRPPTATSGPTNTPSRLPAPTSLTLLRSRGGTEAQVGQLATFKWKWSGQLPENATFEVRIWEGKDTPHYGAYDVKKMYEKIKYYSDNDTYQVSFDVGAAYGVTSSSASRFQWTVAVVQIEPYQRIGDEAALRVINISR